MAKYSILFKSLLFWIIFTLLNVVLNTPEWINQLLQSDYLSNGNSLTSPINLFNAPQKGVLLNVFGEIVLLLFPLLLFGQYRLFKRIYVPLASIVFLLILYYNIYLAVYLNLYSVHPIFENDCEYSITHHDTDCACCVNMDGVGGIIIDGGEPILFNGTTLATDPTKSLKGKQNQIAVLINNAFKTAGIEGSAVVKQQLFGTGAPCCDFKILVNSCVEFDLIDGAGAPLVKVCSNPFEACKKDPYCKGCDDGTEWTPTCGIRVVALGQEITCDCNDPVDRTSWYHREVRVIVPIENNFSLYKIKEIQKATVPTNLGVQWRKRILDAVNGGQGFAYDNWVIEKTGIYQTPRKGTAFTDAFMGLECKDMVCSINIQHGLNYNEKSVNGSKNCARGRSIILINNKDKDLYAEIKEYLDPWLASVSCGNFGPLECTHDIDQVEATNYLDTAGDVPDGSPNTGNLLGGVADGAAGPPPGTDDATGDGIDDPANNDTGN